MTCRPADRGPRSLEAFHRDHSAHGRLQDEVIAVTAVAMASGTGYARLAFVAAGMAEMGQRREVRVGLEDDIAATAPVATVGATKGNELLTAKAIRPITTTT